MCVLRSEYVSFRAIHVCTHTHGISRQCLSGQLVITSARCVGQSMPKQQKFAIWPYVFSLFFTTLWFILLPQFILPFSFAPASKVHQPHSLSEWHQWRGSPFEGLDKIQLSHTHLCECVFIFFFVPPWTQPYIFSVLYVVV